MKMKCRTYATLFAALLLAVTATQGATVAYWDFENSTETGTTPTDGQPFSSASGGAFGSADIVSNNLMRGYSAVYGPSFAEGISPFGGFCMYSSHQDGYVNGSDPLVAWSSPDWTLELHARIDDANGWETLVAKMGSSFSVSESDFYFQRKGIDGNELRLNYMPADATNNSDRIIVDGTNTTLSAGQWYGLAVAVDSTAGTITLYVDDGAGWALEGQTTGLTGRDLGVYSSAFDWAFFRDFYNSGSDPTIGAMDNVRFSNTALSLSELISYPFTITVSPTATTSTTDPTIQATIVDHNSDLSSAELFLDGGSVATLGSSAGPTNVISYGASGLSIGTHTGQVVVVGINPSATITNTWTFEISQPPFDSITIVSPVADSWTTNDNVALEVDVVEAFEAVASAQLSVDGVDVSTAIDNATYAPTTTVTAASGTLSSGVHTGKYVVVSTGVGESFTNEWTFSVVLEASVPTNLVHHWAFDDNGGTTVIDSVGAANGTIIGTNYNWVAGGLDLFGGGSSGDWDIGSTNTAGAGAYVDLPNGIISALNDEVTIEVTYIADTTNGWWQRIYDFGESTAGEGYSPGFVAPNPGPYAGGGTYLFHTTWAGNGTRVALSTNIPPGEIAPLDSGDQNVGNVTHVVWVYDASGKMTKMYQNGVLVDAEIAPDWPLSNLNDVNNWLGRAQYADPLFNGKLYDLRIYNGIMTASEVAVRYADAMNVSGPTVNPDIQSIIVSGGSAMLTWTSESGVTYSILSKAALTDSTWSTNKAGIASAGDGTTSDSVTAGANQEFYQIMGE